MNTPQIILGIDPSLRSTGYAVIKRESSSQLKSLTWGVIKNPSQLTLETCLLNIFQTLQNVIQTYQPTYAAIEKVIYVQNYSIAITLGCAKGAALLAVAEKNLDLFEYTPKQIKLASTGRGSAQKNQVGFMVRALLGLETTPPPDASDALAIAITHAQNILFKIAPPSKSLR